MANANRPSGLAPVQYLSGAPWNGQARVYSIPTTDGSAFAIGDPVVSAASGADVNGIPAVALATGGTGNLIRGVVVGAGTNKSGPYINPTNLSTIVVPATKTVTYYVAVVDDPQVLFEVQEDSVGGALAATDVGTNVNLIAAANNGYLSGWMLDSSSKGTGVTVQCRLFELVQRQDNAIGEFAKWLVLINYHELLARNLGV